MGNTHTSYKINQNSHLFLSIYVHIGIYMHARCAFTGTFVSNVDVRFLHCTFMPSFLPTHCLFLSAIINCTPLERAGKMF